MFSRRAPWLAFIAALLLSTSAFGQSSVTLNQGRDGVNRDHEVENLNLDQINRENCLDNEQITFQLKVNGSPGSSYRLGAWTGTGCDTATNRVGPSATCRRIGEDMVYQVNSPLKLTVQQIVEGVNQTGSASTGEGGTGSGNDGVCEGSSSPVGFTLHFLLVNSNGETPSGYTFPKWEAEFDLEGPEAPRNVRAGIGENRLIISWSIPDDTTTAEMDGYYFFCDPPPGTGTPVEDGGTPSCGLPSATAANACGRALGGAVTSGETSALLNGVSYAVAVAGRDTFFNYGELSDPACEQPEPVTGFFEAYRDAGGKGGGGFCSIGAGRSPAFGGLGALALLGLALRRRQARSRKGSSS
jgi:hypothetical protein